MTSDADETPTPSSAPDASAAELEAKGFLRRLGERVRTTRNRRGMSRRILALRSEVSERYLAQLEAGEGNSSVVLLRRIAQAMGVSPAELLTDGPERSVESMLVQQLLDRLAPEDLAAARAMLLDRFSAGDRGRRAERIALVGLRGGGKSTLGRLTAERLEMPFIELDREIERLSGNRLPEIFELFGQQTFRRLELSALRSVIEEHPRFILSTGGGLVTEPGTYELLLASCVTIWVRASAEEHMQRVIGQGDLRPMADGAQAMQDLVSILASREPLYAKADHTLMTSGHDVSVSLEQLLALLVA